MSTAQEQEIRERIKAFVLRAVNVPNLTDDDNLFESGIVNSLFAIQLLTFIEKTFAIEVGSDDLDMKNFKSLNATAAFVSTKAARPSQAGNAKPV
jgi:methoxymalonate biosynthesis acyl carrier protein